MRESCRRLQHRGRLFRAGGEGWRDLGLLVEGPAAARLAGYFDALLRWTKRARARGCACGARRLRTGASPTAACAGCSAGRRGGYPWTRTVRRDLMQARRVYLIGAYFSRARPCCGGSTGWAARRRPGAGRRPVYRQYLTRSAARFTYRGLLRRRARLRVSPVQAPHQIVRDRRCGPYRIRQFRHAQPVPEPGGDAADRGSPIRRARPSMSMPKSGRSRWK